MRSVARKRRAARSPGLTPRLTIRPIAHRPARAAKILLGIASRVRRDGLRAGVDVADQLQVARVGFVAMSPLSASRNARPPTEGGVTATEKRLTIEIVVAAFLVGVAPARQNAEIGQLADRGDSRAIGGGYCSPWPL
jgi:hypothetical protein